MKKTPKKPAEPAQSQPAPKPAPAAAKPSDPPAPTPTVLGPGVIKRPKRDPAAPPPPEEKPEYTPSEQVFRRR